MKRLSLLAVLGAMAIVPASASAATTYNVTTHADQTGAGFECGTGEECSLRGAIDLADEKSEEATINVPAGEYTSSQDEWVIGQGAEVTIKGAGAGSTTLVGDGASEDFWVEAPSGLTLEGVSVTGGSSSYGAGVYVEGGASLLVENSAITKNQAKEMGGAIFGEAGASVAVRESTVTENEARDGGGIAMANEEICGEASAAHHTAKPHVKRALVDAITSGLTVSRSTIEGNTAEDGAGGGIYNGPVSSGCDLVKQASAHADTLEVLSEEEGGLTIEQSTIAGNHATMVQIETKPATSGFEREGFGGGIYEESRLEENPIVNSTLAGNTAAVTGGGIVDGEGPVLLVNDTVADNRAEGLDLGARSAWRGSSKPAAIADAPAGNLATNVDAFIELRNTILAETTGGEGENCEGDVESYFHGPGHNLDYPSATPEEGGTDNCGLSAEDDDLVDVNPQLSSQGLHANGGPTDTIAIPASSPAIGQVPVSGDCEEGEGFGPALVDQRGEPRPGIAGDGCDIGAYEYQQGPAKPAPMPEPKTTTSSPPAAAVLGVKIASPVCASKRDITIHIQNVKQFGVVSAVISVDGRARRTLTGKHLTTAINLKGLPKGTFTVSIVAHTRSGLTLHGKRTYHTCHAHLPGHVYLRL